MSEPSLQQIVDSLAVRLGRSVAVDDPSLGLVASSPHFGDEDQVRLHSLLNRTVQTANRQYLSSQGIARWSGPGRVAASENLGAKARVCVPVRHAGRHLGYLWLIDPEQSLTPIDLELAHDAAAEAGVVLYALGVRHERERHRTEALLRDLFFGGTDQHATASATIRDDALLVDPGHCAVLVVELHPVAGASPFEAEAGLRAGIEAVSSTLPAHSTLCLVQGLRAVVLLSTPAATGQLPAGSLGRRITAGVDKLGLTAGCRAGVGAVPTGLADARRAYEQACSALRSAALLASAEPVVEWDRIGIYRWLLRLAPDDLSGTEYPDAVVRLLAADPSKRLLLTAEAFLDEAGDAVRAAARLQIHRTTLYYRLRRLEQLADVDLADGQARLSLHLGVKLARLTGALVDPVD